MTTSSSESESECLPRLRFDLDSLSCLSALESLSFLSVFDSLSLRSDFESFSFRLSFLLLLPLLLLVMTVPSPKGLSSCLAVLICSHGMEINGQYGSRKQEKKCKYA